MADPVNSNMPLAGEMALASYLSNLFGSGKTPNPNYTGATPLPPQLVGQMSGGDMQNIMTEFLRGNGQFLQQMMQQNQSGIYNSPTRRLIANDLTAQAALKATQANVPIQQGNASLMNQYYSRLNNQQPQYLPGDPNRKQNSAMALGIAALNKLLEGGLSGKDGKGKTSAKGTGSKSGEKDVGSSIMEALSTAFAGGDSFQQLPEGGFAATAENPFSAPTDNIFGSVQDIGQQMYTAPNDYSFMQDNTIGGAGLGAFDFTGGGGEFNSFANIPSLSDGGGLQSWADMEAGFADYDYSAAPNDFPDFFEDSAANTQSFDFSDWGF